MSDFPGQDPLGPVERRRLFWGVVFWLVFCAVVIPLRGVRWDENLQFAQVITGRVVYPEGHPYPVYAFGAYSLQAYLAALQYWLLPNGVLLSAVREWVTLGLKLTSFFLLVTFLSNRTKLGHAAVLLILLQSMKKGAFLHYKLWPTEFTNGAIGNGWLLLTLALLLARYWRVGYFMLGLMPCIHLGQYAPILGVAILYALWQWLRGDRARMNRALIFFGLGLGVCFLFRLIQLPFLVDPPSSGPYYSDADPALIWKYYVLRCDHRQIPGSYISYLSDHTAMVCALLLGGLAAWREWRESGRPGLFTWLLVFCAGAAGAVWTIMGIHLLLRDEMPFLLISWMPYRIPLEHIFPVMLCMVAGVLGRARADGRGGAAGILVLSAALVWLLVKPLAGGVLPAAFYERYLLESGPVYVGLCGAACAVEFNRVRGVAFKNAWLATAVAGLAFLFSNHQFAAVAAVAGFVAGLLLIRLVRNGHIEWQSARPVRVATAVLGVACVAAVVGREWRDAVPIRREPFDAAVAAYLEEQGEDDAMLVMDNYAASPQARTGHPVMLQWMSASYITYMPSIGPATQKIFGDIYEIPLGVSAHDKHEKDPEHVYAAWANRSEARWRELGRRYGFRYVIAPNDVPMAITSVLVGDTKSLYRIAG